MNERLYGGSLTDRLDNDWEFLDAVAHRNGMPHCAGEVIGVTDPATGDGLGIAKVAGSGGDDPWRIMLIVQAGAKRELWVQTSQTEAEYTPADPDVPSDRGSERLVELYRGATALRRIAAERPHLIGIGEVLVIYSAR